jgi:flagellar hook-associated protein 1 FlgK
MGTLTALLNLSQSALQASQAAIEITANNVANSNTPGYTDQIAIWRANDTVSLSGAASLGEGPTVTALSQRDPVLNHRVQQQAQLESSSSTESVALQDLQSLFGITSTSTSAVSTTIGTDINSFFNSLSALEASPSNSSVRRGILNAATALASDFNGTSAQIAQQTSSLNQQVSATVTQINALTSSIAALNLQIQSASPKSDAGTLEDRRQQDLTQLSKLIGFDQTKTENNGLTLSAASGALLVSEGHSFALDTSVVNGNTNVVSAAGQDLTSSLTGGALGGLILARDRDLPQVSSALDSLAYAIGTAVNTQNQAGLDANGNPGGKLFNLPASLVGSSSTISIATLDPNAVAAAAVGEGSSGNTNATALKNLANATLVDNQSASGFYASFLTQLGSTVSRVADQNTTQHASLTQLTTFQSSQSSVSLNDEAANLTRYERSFDAAAKIFAIVDQLMASALNLGQQTTVT